MANKFQEKKYLAEVLNELYESVDHKEQDIHYTYQVVGEEQAKDWRTDELLWLDEEKTIPKMRDKWANISKSEDEITEEDKMKIKVCQYIKTQLEKML
jgi:DNA gyrase inhibitor GyrI